VRVRVSPAAPPVRILNCTDPETLPAALAQAVAVLQGGGVVVYPTETVYGLGVDATNPDAVQRLLQIKDRPAGKAISVLVANPDAADRYVLRNNQARTLYQQFLPGPLTVVSTVIADSVDMRLPSELGRLGIRISSHPVAAGLAAAFDCAITATSANPAGAARPYVVQSLLATFSDHQRSLIDLVLDYGPLLHAEPSSVIDTEEQVQTIVRAGATFSQLATLSDATVTHTVAETVAYAVRCARQHRHVVAEKALILALQGEMGAGKTHFTQGLAQGFGFRDQITSPSYTLVKEYVDVIDGHQLTLIHADCWRTPTISLSELGLGPQTLVPGHILCIEWPAPVMVELGQLAADNQIVLRVIDFELRGEDRFIRIS
jgi:L-threonylcarbamoyladenylate synthase